MKNISTWMQNIWLKYFIKFFHIWINLVLMHGARNFQLAWVILDLKTSRNQAQLILTLTFAFYLIKIEFKSLNSKINQINTRWACTWVFRPWIMSRLSLDHKILGPFEKYLHLLSISLCVSPKKCSTCTICILLNFQHF